MHEYLLIGHNYRYLLLITFFDANDICPEKESSRMFIQRNCRTSLNRIKAWRSICKPEFEQLGISIGYVIFPQVLASSAACADKRRDDFFI